MARRPGPPKRQREPAPFGVTTRDSMREWLEDRLNALPELRVQRMFGGAGIYSGETMFGILAEARVYFKTDDASREAFVARGMGPFRANAKTVLKSYYEVPPEVLEDEAELVAWARLALQVANASANRRRVRAKAMRE